MSYISREELIKECIRYGNHEHNIQFKPDVSERRKHDSDVVMYMCEHFKKFAEKLPSADVRENVHGAWKLYGWPTEAQRLNCTEIYACSNCKYKVSSVHAIIFNFCPNCGCQMNKESNNVNE